MSSLVSVVRVPHTGTPMKIVQAPLVRDTPSSKYDEIPNVLRHWSNNITAWQTKQVIGIAINGVDHAGLNEYYILLKSDDDALPYNNQWALDGLPGNRPRGDVFIIKIDNFKPATETKYRNVSAWLPNSTVAIEILREGAILREHFGEPWTLEKPVYMALECLNQYQNSRDFERFKGSENTEEVGFYKGQHF